MASSRKRTLDGGNVVPAVKMETGLTSIIHRVSAKGNVDATMVVASENNNASPSPNLEELLLFKRRRRNGGHHILSIGRYTPVPMRIIAVASMHLLNFFQSSLHVNYAPCHIAESCLTIACKHAQAQRKESKQIIQISREILHKAGVKILIDDHSAVLLERHILCVLGFHLSVVVPHDFLDMLRGVADSALYKSSWKLATSILSGDLLLRYSPEVLACACVVQTLQRMPL